MDQTHYCYTAMSYSPCTHTRPAPHIPCFLCLSSSQHVHTQGWCLPELSSPPDTQLSPQAVALAAGSLGRTPASASAPPHAPTHPEPPHDSISSLYLERLRPYYLGPTDNAVPNDVEMHNNLWLLTGANMAGKLLG